jgi:DNA adenine methylase
MIGLVDRDPLIAAFWDTVFHDADWLTEQVSTIDVTLEHWHRFKTTPLHERRERALACLFLNRTSYSGILNRRSGPIGGQAQTSRYTIDCRFPRTTLIERIKRLSAWADRVAFVACDSWEGALARVSRLQETERLSSDDAFYYVDPPFFKKAERLYTYYFQAGDHRSLRDTLVELKERWVLSYDAGCDVEELYGMVDNKVYLHVPYSTGTARTERRDVRTEAIIGHRWVRLPLGLDRPGHRRAAGPQSVRKPMFQAPHDGVACD